MFYQNQKYQEYIENLKQNGVKLVGYRAPCCDKKVETMANTGAITWDTLADCPHCGSVYIKVTLPNGLGANASLFAPDSNEALAGE